MKTRKMIVPRYVIERHFPHPEFYGESFVLLENNMTTDVYTDLDGRLYTETNNKYLIKFLNACNQAEEQCKLVKDFVQLTALNALDQDQIKSWFMISPLKRFDLIADSDDLTRQYISHSKTKNSEVFMIEINQKKVGFIGFTRIDQVIIIHIEIYEHNFISIDDMCNIIQLLNEQLKIRYSPMKVIFLTNEYDVLLNDALKQCHFNKSQRTPILLQTITGYILEFEYEYLLE
jgi:hypothetical protein